MMPLRQSTHNGSYRPAGWGIVPVGATSLARELPIVVAGIGLFYSVVSFARYWSGPIGSQAEISLHPAALPKYALFSVLRLAIAYIFSFVFTLVYGYVAAYNRKAERFMIPLLDTLQSIPVLSFLPGVMISMAALFPSRQLGVELGSVLQLTLRGMKKDCPFFPRIFKRPLKLFLTTDRSEPTLCIGMIECIQSRL
jgi:hypothetical protein